VGSSAYFRPFTVLTLCVILVSCRGAPQRVDVLPGWSAQRAQARGSVPVSADMPTWPLEVCKAVACMRCVDIVHPLGAHPVLIGGAWSGIDVESFIWRVVTNRILYIPESTEPLSSVAYWL
jgi:hypothetical protein